MMARPTLPPAFAPTHTRCPNCSEIVVAGSFEHRDHKRSTGWSCETTQLARHHLRMMEQLGCDALQIALSKATSPVRRALARSEVRCFNEIAQHIRAQLPESQR